MASIFDQDETLNQEFKPNTHPIPRSSYPPNWSQVIIDDYSEKSMNIVNMVNFMNKIRNELYRTQVQLNDITKRVVDLERNQTDSDSDS